MMRFRLAVLAAAFGSFMAGWPGAYMFCLGAFSSACIVDALALKKSGRGSKSEASG